MTTTEETQTETVEETVKADEGEKPDNGKAKKAKKSKADVTAIIKSWVAVLLAGLLRSVAIYVFIVPNHFAPGGLTGIATMLENGTGINSGYFLFAANLPLLIIAFIFINKDFALKSTVSLALSSVLLVLWEYVDKALPNVALTFAGDDYTRLLAAIAGGILGGLAMGLIMNAGGSNGGTDIIATLIQRKHSATNVAWFIFLLDATVVLASFFVYDFQLTPVLLALIEMFASSKVGEVLISGVKAAIKVEIITHDAGRLANDIINKLGRGVTCVPAVGMYTHENTNLLICILRKQQLSVLRNILKDYPESFAYISSTSEVMGRGFSHIGK